jgi:hypothetical protein
VCEGNAGLAHSDAGRPTRSIEPGLALNAESGLIAGSPDYELGTRPGAPPPPNLTSHGFNDEDRHSGFRCRNTLFRMLRMSPPARHAVNVAQQIANRSDGFVEIHELLVA